MPWDELGLAPTEDERSIKRAYASRLKQTRPEDDQQGFERLRRAYEQALWICRNGVLTAQAEAEKAAEPAEASEASASGQRAESSVSEQPASTAQSPASTVRTVFWRDVAQQQDAQSDEAAIRELLRQAAFDDALDDTLVLEYCERYGWLGEQPQSGDAPAEWLSRVRARSQYIHARRAGQLLIGMLPEQEGKACERFQLIARMARWESLDARDMLKRVLADQLRGLEAPPMQLLQQVIDWAGWRDEHGEPAQGIPFDAALLCLLQKIAEQQDAASSHALGPSELKRMLEALCQAAYAPELDAATLLDDAHRYGWFDPKHDWSAWPLDWLSRARSRVYSSCAQQLLDALRAVAVPASNADGLLQAFQQFETLPAWQDPAARSAMAELIAQWLHEVTQPQSQPVRFMETIALWAGWMHADGEFFDGLESAAAWLCRQISLHRIWDKWQGAVAGQRPDVPAEHREVLGNLLGSKQGWRRRLSALWPERQTETRRTLLDIEENLPELFDRIPEAQRNWWRQPRISLADGNALVMLLALLIGLISCVAVARLFSEPDGKPQSGWGLLLGLAAWFVVTTGLSLAYSASKLAWSNLMEVCAARWPKWANALQAGFKPFLHMLLFVAFCGIASGLASAAFELSRLGHLALWSGTSLLAYGACFIYFARQPQTEGTAQSEDALATTSREGSEEMVRQQQVQPEAPTSRWLGFLRYGWLIWLAFILLRNLLSDNK